MQCLLTYNWIYPIINEAVSKELDDDLDFRPQEVIKSILGALRSPLMQREDSVLLLNLGLHFPIGVNFTTYQRLIRDLITRLKESKVDSQGKLVPKYKAKVIWKTSSAIHKENALIQNKTNWRFFTTQVNETNTTSVWFDSRPHTSTFGRTREEIVSVIPTFQAVYCTDKRAIEMCLGNLNETR